MKAIGPLAAALILSVACRGGGDRPAVEANAAPAVKSGLEVLLAGRADLVRGKRIGLISNPTGVDRSLRPAADLLRAVPEAKLVALYGPEHGVRGNAQAGEYVPYYLDPKYGIPVFSLYGQSLKPDPGMLRNIDAYMRSFDTQDSGKIPEASMVEDIDVLLYDMQDVGTRVYTYIATMAYAMQACAESGVEFVVLDRPNPVNGLDMEGPILDYPAFSSFVGLYPIPLRHGMTIGELARLFNDRFLAKKARLTVVAAEGWSRDMWFDGTGLPWVIPSPNMPTPETATVYPGQVFFEGTNVSEGRGTTRPFELFGAAWIDGFDLARALNGLGLPGVLFREAWFTPTFSKFAGAACGGCQVHVMDRGAYRPLETALHVIKTIRDLYPDRFEFHADYFDKIMGTDRVRLALERGDSVAAIVDSFRAGLAEFGELRKPYLLY